VDILNVDLLYSAFRVEVIFSDGAGTKTCSGTGFFVLDDQNIYLVTNRHVVDVKWNQPGKSKNHSDYFGFVLQDINCTGRPSGDSLRNFKLLNPNIIYSDQYTDDVAVIPVRQIVTLDGSEQVTLDRGIPTNLFAPESLFNCSFEGINISDQITYPVYSAETSNNDNRPALRMGWIVSDPRYSLDMPEVKGSVLLTESFSTAGASGAPVFVLPRGFRIAAGNGINISGDLYRPIYLVGVNAGHFKSSDHDHANLSYAFKSTVIMDCIRKAKAIEVAK
jgi:hypothetical protein